MHPTPLPRVPEPSREHGWIARREDAPLDDGTTRPGSAGHAARVRPRSSRSAQVIVLLGFLIAALSAGAVGPVLTFAGLHDQRPHPGWDVSYLGAALVWTATYALVGVAGYLVWLRPRSSARASALRWYGAQLVAPALWTLATFGLASDAAGVAAMVLVCLTVLGTLIEFFRVRAGAAALMVPALAGAFATLVLSYRAAGV